MYKELLTLKGTREEVYTLEAPSLTKLDPKNYMVQADTTVIETNIALLDSASVHTILQAQPLIWVQNLEWALGNMWSITIAGKQNFWYRKAGDI